MGSRKTPGGKNTTWLGPGYCRYVDPKHAGVAPCNAKVKYSGRGPRPKWCRRCKKLVDAERNRRNVNRSRARHPETTRLNKLAYRRTDRILDRLGEDQFPTISRGRVLDIYRSWHDPLPNPENHVQAVLADTLFIRVGLKKPWDGGPILLSLNDLDNIAFCAMTEDLWQFGQGAFEEASPPLLQGEVAEETLGPFLAFYEHARSKLGWDRKGTIWFNCLRVSDCFYSEYWIEPPELEEGGDAEE